MADSRSSGPRDRLEESLKRVLDAVAHFEERQARWIEDRHRRTGELGRDREDGERPGSSFSAELQREIHRKLERKLLHKLERHRYRQARREAKREARARAHAGRASWFRSVLNGGMAIGCAAAAIADPTDYGFMVYVGVAFGLMSLRSLPLWRRATREVSGPREQVSANPDQDPRIGRVGALCDKILAELKASSRVLQEFVHQPEQTVTSLRVACHELVRRELELRAAAPEAEHARFQAEREMLAARLQAERDEVVRQRLSGALAALDEQLAQRAELATVASRLEAEHTRLYYTLEGLYTQVLRVKSADASSAEVAGAGLKQSLTRLSEELDAVAVSLDAVSRGEERLAPISPLSAPEGDGAPTPGQRERS